MSYRDQQDEVVMALRAIALGEVVPTLDLGGAAFPAIRKTYGYPIPLAQLGTLELPALSIYVASERSMPVGRHRDLRLNVTMEYVGPVTAMADLDSTWPMLRKVWFALIRAIEAGTVGGLDVLRLTGVQWLADEEASVEYDSAPGSAGAFPYFVSRFWLQLRPSEGSAASLPALTQLYANLDLYEGVTKTKDNLVTVRGTTS